MQGVQQNFKILTYDFTSEFFNPVLFNFRKSIAFWKVPRIRPVVLLVTAAVDKGGHRALVEF